MGSETIGKGAIGSESMGNKAIGSESTGDEAMDNPPVLAIVVPCFNEEDVLAYTEEELNRVLTGMIRGKQVSPKSRILFVDDGSGDGTWAWIVCCAEKNPLVEGISLGRNVGHQSALYAGLMEVRAFCDMAVSLDADLQDDPALIPAMVRQFLAGNDIVYAVRKSRKGEGGGKKASAFFFYRLMSLLGSDMPKDCGDFRLLSKKALEELSLYREKNPFLRGLLPLLGLPSAMIYFDRQPRKAGKSKYSLVKMMKFAASGMISLTPWPVYLVFWLGAGIVLAAAAGFLGKLCSGGWNMDWQAAVISVWAGAGLILMGIGVIGLYILRIWQEVSGRPHYRIRKDTRRGN